MSTHDTTQPAAETLQRKLTVEEIDRADAENYGFDAVNALWAFVDKDTIAPAALAHWIAGCRHLAQHIDLTNPEHVTPRWIAHVWLLDAMIASPAAVTAALQTMRDKLVETHAELQPFVGVDEAT